MNKKSFWMCAVAAVLVSILVSGCGSTTYFAGRTLPPSKLTNRVLIAIQNPNALTKGALQFVDGYYDTRSGYNGTPTSFSISGFTGFPATIQNMPEEQLGAVYSSADGSVTMINYEKEAGSGQVSGLSGLSSSVFVTRNQTYAFAASETAHVMTIVNRAAGTAYTLSLPGIYRVSVNPGGTVALAFVQNSNYVYYPLQLSAGQTTNYSGGPSSWPKAAVDCEPQNAPAWCLMQAQSPDTLDATGHYTGVPLSFDRPVKAIFSPDGSAAYVLSCGAECGGTTASVTPVPVAPMIFLASQASGKLPTQSAMGYCTSASSPTSCRLQIPGGASNALVGANSSGTSMYVVGQHLMSDGYWAGNLTVVKMATGTTPASIVPPTVSSPASTLQAVSISDGAPPVLSGLDGPVSRMIEADDNTLWIGMSKCTNGERAANPSRYANNTGCLTMYNESTGAVLVINNPNPGSGQGDATGIAAVTSLHKIYTAVGGQVYIYSTVDGHAMSNEFVAVTGTAIDVAYMDGLTDSNNTVY